MTQFDRRIALAMTGASGSRYGLRLLEQLLAANCQVYFMISRAAQVVLAQEGTFRLPGEKQAQQRVLETRFRSRPGQLRVLGREEWTAPVASGSALLDGMVVCPCSTGSLSAIAQGACNNLIERAADVALKERRPLILVPRETPYSRVHLENMLKLHDAGATVLPASPGFYHHPEEVEDLVDFVVARILDQLAISQTLVARWGYGRPPSSEHA